MALDGKFVAVLGLKNNITSAQALGKTKKQLKLETSGMGIGYRIILPPTPAKA